MTISLGVVLIVDDNEDDRFILKRLLSRAGIAQSVLEAEDGAKAIELLRDCSRRGFAPCPNVAFLDLHMPEMDGFQFLKAQQQERLPVKVVPMLSVDMPQIQLDQIESYPTVVGSLIKMPLSPQELCRGLSPIEHAVNYSR
ncbi:MAG: response regulator [Myxococcota bacterium]